MVDKAEARHAISALIYGYADALDTGDLDGVAGYFEHCVIRVHDTGDTFEGTAGVREMFARHTAYYDSEGLADPESPQSHPHTKHVTTNLVIEVDDGGGSARARSYFTVLQARPGFPLQIVIAGRYHDRFECIDGEWRFSERVEFCDLMGDLSHHLRENPLERPDED
ncbi:MAG: nuclear transport factor 2 family protein [Proteobacteria bacterium]|nr:nuclear transport factor 2 family protein [Pseudomonadota bacterium]